jgi:hypothetical protein
VACYKVNFTFTPIRISRNTVWEKFISPLPLTEVETGVACELSKKQFYVIRVYWTEKTLSHFQAVGMA